MGVHQIFRESFNFGFDRIEDFTTDTFQGDEGFCPFADSVRTDSPGFTGDRGRNVLLIPVAANANAILPREGDNPGSTPIAAQLITKS